MLQTTTDLIVIGLAKNFVFFHTTALVMLSCLELYSKLVNCEAILILKMEENKQHFWCIMFYYLKKSKNTTETQKNICAVYKEML